jgi:hypothetical protein
MILFSGLIIKNGIFKANKKYGKNKVNLQKIWQMPYKIGTLAWHLATLRQIVIFIVRLPLPYY